MPARPSLARLAASLAGLWLLLPGCQAPGSTRIIGPDGSPMAHVHCGFDQGACFRMAGELCPSGYELKPVLSGNDGNFLVRCRAPGAPQLAVQYVPAPPPANPLVLAPPVSVASAPTAAAQAPKETWPPAAEPPLMYPWPPPESSAAVRTPAKPTTPQGDVDIGY